MIGMETCHVSNKHFLCWKESSAMKVDNFTLEQFTCPAKYDLRIRRGLVPLRRKPSLSFGSVVHVGLAEWYRTGDFEKALKKVYLHWPEVMPSDDFRTRDYALKVLGNYF